MRTKRFSRYVNISLVFSAISSLAVLASMLDVEREHEQTVIMITSSLFWLCLAIEQLYIWRANALRKKIEAKSSVSKIVCLPGICNFAKNIFGTVADVLFGLSLIAYIVLSTVEIGPDVIQYILLFVIVLSFRVHCIANGKNYRYKLLLNKKER